MMRAMSSLLAKNSSAVTPSVTNSLTTGPDHVYAQNAVGFGICQHFDRTFGFAHRQSAAIRTEAGSTFFVFHAFGFKLLFGFATQAISGSV